MLVSMAKLSGLSLIGAREGARGGEPMYASNPTTGQRLQPAFIPATPEEVDLSARLAGEAFGVYRRVSGRDRGAFSVSYTHLDVYKRQVYPSITGSAFVTAEADLILDPQDPLRMGIRGESAP